MDEDKLRSLLADVPLADENAKKRAVNLAVAEFNAAHSERIERKFQGPPLHSRLIGGHTDEKRRVSMFPRHRKLVYGGLVTASVALLAVTSAVYVAQEKASFEPASVGLGDIAASSESDRVRRQAAATEEGDALRAPPPTAEAPPEPPAGPTLAPPKRVPGEARERAELEFELAEIHKRSAQTKSNGGVSEGPAVETFTGAPPQAVLETGGLHLASSDHYRDAGRDRFEDFETSPLKRTAEAPVSTFSIDVDTASYSFVRRMLNSGVLPQKDAVRIEEMINYFDYAYPLPASREQPFEPSVALAPSPWAPDKLLMHIGIKGFDVAADEKPRSNLVFLIDVSGSMDAPDKLPLVKQSLKMLVDGLGPDDTVAIVVYAGAAGTVLEPTHTKERGRIIAALERLSAGGSTAGAEGIRQAYALAESQFEEDAVNRVILATDGDFNVGITNPRELQDFIERKRETGVYLSVLGFGQGNLNDRLMQRLAQNGNGAAAYIDTLNEARKVLLEEAASNLFPIARDVKIQVEFNPALVAEYRLIGYETRALRREDFNNDAVDAGDIGAGHTVTAIYEITPAGSGAALIDARRYGEVSKPEAKNEVNDGYAFLKIRYKLPGEKSSSLITRPITVADEVDEEGAGPLSRETAFAAAVAGFGQLLRGGRHTGDFTYDDVADLARKSKGDDEFGYRSEFIQLVRLAKIASGMTSR